MGKGFVQRPYNQKKFSENWDKIFGGQEVCENCGYMKFENRICTKCFRLEVEDAKERRD